jgi:solute carrier family 35 protein F1/2
MYGDMLAFASASLYGLNDVLLEYTVKANNDRIEYLGMIGLFGFLFSFFIQAPLFEKQELREMFYGTFSNSFTDASVLILCVFILTMSYFYICVTVFLSVNDATILNLSLQSSPLWAVILTTLMVVVDDASEWEPVCACMRLEHIRINEKRKGTFVHFKVFSIPEFVSFNFW